MGARNFSYGTTFDAEISSRVARGQVMTSIASDLAVSAFFVRTRIISLGLMAAMRANAMAERSAQAFRREAKKRLRPAHERPPRPSGLACRTHAGAHVLAITAPTSADPVPAALARRLRGRSVPFTRNAIGCLHRRGLTVDELHSITGKPVPFIVDAIQRAASCL